MLVSCSRQGSGLPPREAQEFLAKSDIIFFLVCVILACSLLQTEVVRVVAPDRSFPCNSSFACPLG